jgi:hypothetical protein
MLQDLNPLTGSSLIATDGELGTVRNFLLSQDLPRDMLRLTGIVQKQPLQIDFVKSAYLFVHRRYRKTRPRG